MVCMNAFLFWILDHGKTWPLKKVLFDPETIKPTRFEALKNMDYMYIYKVMQLFLGASIACIGIGIEGLGHCVQLGWWFQISFIWGNDPIWLAYHMFQMSHEKKPSYFPLYWLVTRDPYSGFLYSLYNRVGFHPLYNLNNQGYFHCSNGKQKLLGSW